MHWSIIAIQRNYDFCSLAVTTYNNAGIIRQSQCIWVCPAITFVHVHISTDLSIRFILRLLTASLVQRIFSPHTPVTQGLPTEPGQWVKACQRWPTSGYIDYILDTESALFKSVTCTCSQIHVLNRPRLSIDGVDYDSFIHSWHSCSFNRMDLTKRAVIMMMLNKCNKFMLETYMFNNFSCNTNFSFSFN